MKVVIDIPKEFEQHFNEDKFKDSLLTNLQFNNLVRVTYGHNICVKVFGNPSCILRGSDVAR